MFKTLRLCLSLAVVPAAVGCNAYRLDPPTGFAQVEKDEYGARMKAGDNVGLNVRVFQNVKGGTLAFWSEDLVHKLGLRGYTLVSQQPVKSKNRVQGTKLDFAYETQDRKEKKFYTAVLYVTDRKRVVVQLAGDADQQERYVQTVAKIAGDIKVRGCKALTKTCRGPQPDTLQAPAPAEKPTLAKEDAQADDEPDAEG